LRHRLSSIRRVAKAVKRRARLPEAYQLTHDRALEWGQIGTIDDVAARDGESVEAERPQESADLQAK
jgi:hypothetical protein